MPEAKNGHHCYHRADEAISHFWTPPQLGSSVQEPIRIERLKVYAGQGVSSRVGVAESGFLLVWLARMALTRDAYLLGALVD
jgi:hypothetical protein